MGLGILPPPGIAPPKAPDVQDFTTSGTWTKPDGAKWCFIEAVGGGQSGFWQASPNYYGGVGGGYMQLFLPAVSVADSLSISIGAGGAVPAKGSAANAGGSTTISPGDSLIAWGGSGQYAPTARSGTWSGGLGGQTAGGGSAQLGAGGGASVAGGTGSPGRIGGTGGTLAAERGLLQAGNGASLGVAATIGGGGYGSTPTAAVGQEATAGAPGAARITTYF